MSRFTRPGWFFLGLLAGALLGGAHASAEFASAANTALIELEAAR